MTSLCHIWGAVLLSVLPVAVGQVEPQPPDALQLCTRLLEESREVDRLLRTVSDRESGQKVAAELRSKMEFLQGAACRLGLMPLESAESARQLEQMMRDMMHVTQGYMPVVLRLVEVNAYGAEELLQLFQYYKMGTLDAAGSARANESPLVRSCTEWCDGIDDLLYMLRQAQDAPAAAALAYDELERVIGRVSRLAAEVERLQTGLSPRQLESEPLPTARVQRLKAELRTETNRLRDAAYFGQERLKIAIEKSAKAARL